MEKNPKLKRAGLSRKLCELFAWVKPNGEIKDMTCRVALLRMQADGLITLPPSQLLRPRGKPHFPPTPLSDPQASVQQPVHGLGPLTLRPVSGTAPSRLWNEYIARYHCLGYTPMSGSQMRYNIFAGERLVALLSFGASAWKLKARENFVGWSEARRQHNLLLVVNNARFLILPRIQSKGLASKILPKAARQMPGDWLARYGFRPVLLETFVEFESHRGTCYKAANWQRVHRMVTFSWQKTRRSPRRCSRCPTCGKPAKSCWHCIVEAEVRLPQPADFERPGAMPLEPLPCATRYSGQWRACGRERRSLAHWCRHTSV